MGRAYNESISIPFGVGICGSVAETKETIYIRDAYKDPRFNSDVDAQTVVWWQLWNFIKWQMKFKVILHLNEHFERMK